MYSDKTASTDENHQKLSLVLYCLIRRRSGTDGPVEFLLIHKQGHPTFPPTKFRPGENLYNSLIRTMEEDLGLPRGSHFPEKEIDMIPNQAESPRYPGLTKKWYLYPVDVSLTGEALLKLEQPSNETVWWSVDEILERVQEPNVLAIAAHVREKHPYLLEKVHTGPSMDALAAYWAARNASGVRLVRGTEIRSIIDAGSRAFNIRVADPYLPYQRQGLGFTWSFFSPKDKQDVHLHGLPAVEIYGILEGKLQIWHKPMNDRGVRTWQCMTLGMGDWVEVEPLHCHFAYWVKPQGLGTVIKAAGMGELAGVGKLGVSGKTTCQHCNVHEQCTLHPLMVELLNQYSKPYEERDYARINALATEAELS